MSNGKQAKVSSFSAMFKKATQVSDDVQEVRKQHRENLNTLVNKYMDDLQNGKAEGIRNAKDLVEIMKMDLLLIGDVTDRTEQNSALDEVKINKISQLIDENDETIQDLMSDILQTLNEENDNAD